MEGIAQGIESVVPLVGQIVAGALASVVIAAVVPAQTAAASVGDQIGAALATALTQRVDEDYAAWVARLKADWETNVLPSFKMPAPTAPTPSPAAMAAAATGGGGGGGGPDLDAAWAAAKFTAAVMGLAGAVPSTLGGIAEGVSGQAGLLVPAVGAGTGAAFGADFGGAVAPLAEKQDRTNDLLERLIAVLEKAGVRVTREQLEGVIADAWTGAQRRGAFRGAIG
jgi:hypothetical protein